MQEQEKAVLDFYDYRSDELARYLGERYDWIHEIDPLHPVTGGKGPSIYIGPSYPGTDPYDPWKSHPREHLWVENDNYTNWPWVWPMTTDIAFSASHKAVEAAEFNSREMWTVWRRKTDFPTKPPWRASVLPPAKLTQFMWQAIGHGLKSAMLWSTKATRCGELGTLDEFALPTETAVALGELNGVAKTIAGVFNNALPPEDFDLAIYLPHDTWRRKHHLKPVYAYDVEVGGVHEILNRLGYTATFLTETSQQWTQEYLNSFRVVVMVWAPIMNRQSVNMLAQYVRQGGTLLAIGAPAWRDELLRRYTTWPAAEFASVFGASVQRLSLAQPLSVTLHLSSLNSGKEAHIHIPLSYEFDSRLWQSSCEELQSDGAQVLARFSTGAAAITVNRCGKGRAIRIGFPAGAHFRTASQGGKSLLRSLILSLLKASGSPPVYSENPGVETALLQNATRYFLVLINHEATPAETDVTLALPLDIKQSQIWDLLAQQRASLNARADIPRLKVELRPHEILLFTFLSR